MSDDTLGLWIMLVFGFWVYFAPAALAFYRKVPNVWSVVVINAFLGWTLVGWVVALAMAVRTVPKPVVG